MTGNAELFQRKMNEDAGLRWRLECAERAFASDDAGMAFRVVVVPIARSVGIELTSDDVLALVQPTSLAA